MKTVRELLASRARKPPPTICQPDRRIDDVLETMKNGGLASIPVVDQGKLIEILTLGELIAAHEDEKSHDTLSTCGYVTQDSSGPKPAPHDADGGECSEVSRTDLLGVRE